MKVFIAGPIAVKQLDSNTTQRLDSIIRNNCTVLVGDANGVDKLVQQYLFSKNYRNVVVYACENSLRNNIGHWNVVSIRPDDGLKGFEFYACKDRQMVLDADYGFMIWNGKSRGTLNNIISLAEEGTNVLIYLTPHKRFYHLKTPDEVKNFIALFNEDVNKLFKKLSFENAKKYKGYLEQISLF